MRKLLLCAAIIGAMVTPGAVRAQIAWDTPMLLPPGPADDFGIYLIDLHHGGVGAMGTWRSAVYNFGLRAGIAERDGEGGIGVFGGVDYNGLVTRSTDEFPLDVDWILGAGIGVGDHVRVSAPVGLTGGHSFEASGATFTPYASPRVVLDAFFGSSAERNLGLDFAVDLGLDLRIGMNTGGILGGSTIRFGGTIGNRTGVALGVVF
jgi:hypothetical protein